MFWATKKSDKEDMETAVTLVEFTEEMSDIRNLWRFLMITVVGNVVIWAITVLLADWIYSVMSRIFTDKIGVLVLGIPFGFGLYLTYCLLRLWFPDVEENKNLASDVMGSFDYQSASAKRWLVWVFSALGGIINLGALILANMYFADQL